MRVNSGMKRAEDEEDIIDDWRWGFCGGCECGNSGDLDSVFLSSDGAVFIRIDLIAVRVSR
jgi:hypothetical protein